MKSVYRPMRELQPGAVKPGDKIEFLDEDELPESYVFQKLEINTGYVKIIVRAGRGFALGTELTINSKDYKCWKRIE